jgi:hypothetical protein
MGQHFDVATLGRVGGTYDGCWYAEVQRKVREELLTKFTVCCVWAASMV